MDDVWIEHAYWFPKCGFVLLMRGHKFIKHSIDIRGSLNLSVIIILLLPSPTILSINFVIV